MSIKRLHTSEQLFVVPQGDEYLRVVPYSLLQHGERALADLVLLEGTQLRLIELRLGDMHVLTTANVSLDLWVMSLQGRTSCCPADEWRLATRAEAERVCRAKQGGRKVWDLDRRLVVRAQSHFPAPPLLRSSFRLSAPSHQLWAV